MIDVPVGLVVVASSGVGFDVGIELAHNTAEASVVAVADHLETVPDKQSSTHALTSLVHPLGAGTAVDHL